MASWVICQDCLWKYDLFTISLFTPGRIYTIVQLSFMDINGITIKIMSTIVVVLLVAITYLLILFVPSGT